MKRLSLLTLAIAIASLSLSSCNTIAGAGEDLIQGGQAVTGAAQRVAN